MNKFRTEKAAKAISNFWGKPLKDSDWYSMDTSEGQTEILIYDVIGWPYVDANTFARDLSRIDSNEITIGINSPGGDLFDGTAIFNAIDKHPARITTRIDGVAASMASIIALAGDEIQIASNAYYMMHNPWSIAMGDYREFSEMGALLERFADNLAQTYSDKTGIDIAEARAMMDAETWIIGQELVDQGFADKVIGGKKAAAAFDLSMYANAPKEITGKSAKKPIKTEREFEQFLTQDAGLTRSQAKAVINSGFKSAFGTQDAGDSENLEALNKLISKMETHNV